MDQSLTFTPMASTNEPHRMGAMTLYKGKPVVTGGLFATNTIAEQYNEATASWSDTDIGMDSK